jgi:tight adherence protein C
VTALAALAGVLAACALAELLAARQRDRGPRAVLPEAVAAGEDRLAGADAARPTAAPAVPAGPPAMARALVRLVAILGRPFPSRAPSGLARRIAAAGVQVGVAEVMALKAGAALGGLGLAILLEAGVPGELSRLVLFGGPLAGFLGPDAWLRRRILRRRRAMDDQLADILELLRVAIDAGLTVPRALGEVGRRHPGVLAGELRHAAGLMALGVAQRQAMEVLVRRCPAPGVLALTAALGRAERHGAPLGDALAAQAEEARARRAREAIEVAARAAPKIQLIVALLLVPSAMLLMAAAMLPALSWR